MSQGINSLADSMKMKQLCPKFERNQNSKSPRFEGCSGQVRKSYPEEIEKALSDDEIRSRKRRQAIAYSSYN
jgi:hypothetical protein